MSPALRPTVSVVPRATHVAPGLVLPGPAPRAAHGEEPHPNHGLGLGLAASFGGGRSGMLDGLASAAPHPDLGHAFEHRHAANRPAGNDLVVLAFAQRNA